ncbi:Fe-S cluster assembly protein SufD [Agaribacterium haliotis]|uniref:Fe-S cluster assembly protein SufD n=1 Tax=Agaribacterium haliotis TaxID=2013869 RepID=UPI000BB5674A|nr:Fe-S cluster assembly protein SufD [Agaribacterium haliotis]
MADFLISSQQAEIDGPAFLADIKAQGKALWSGFELPTRKSEDWKYTSVAGLKKRDFFKPEALAAARRAGETFSGAELEALTHLPAYEAQRLVFVNGVYRKDLSLLDAEAGVELLTFDDASEVQQALIKSKLNSCFELADHRFAALNNQMIDGGVLLHVSANTAAKKPVHIVNISTQCEQDFAVNQRLLLVLEKSAQLTLVEQFCTTATAQNSFVNSVSECVLAENASLRHYRLQDEQETALHIGAVHASLERSARLNSFYLTLGSELKRLDVSVTYRGENAEAEINGVYLPQNKQHVDVHSCIEHAVPHCQTNEVFRGIVADEARAVFNGRIHIHPDAQKTEAYLSNKNLLTSNKAEVDTKPELEIYADDVRCAHGATVAQLDDLGLHYLRTRGISEKEARVLLSFAFINELLEEIADEQLLAWARSKLTGLFSRDPALTKHLL